MAANNKMQMVLSQYTSIMVKLFKAFMRYRGNNICREERTTNVADGCGRWTAQKHNAFIDIKGRINDFETKTVINVNVNGK